MFTYRKRHFCNFNFYNLQKKIKDNNYNLKFIFTPAQDLLFLPEKAMAIDFAYAVNQKLGDNSIGVKVDGEIKNLSYVLKNADTVEVITGYRTTEEDIKLRQTCLKQTREHLENKIIDSEKKNAIELGKKIFEDRLSPRGILDLEDIGSDIHGICYSLGCENVGEIYYKISRGYLDIEKLDDLLNKYDITKNKQKKTTIETAGVDKPGLLKIITDSVTKSGGNITRIVFNKNKDNPNFYLRIVVENLSSIGAKNLKKTLSKNKYFHKIKIV